MEDIKSDKIECSRGMTYPVEMCRVVFTSFTTSTAAQMSSLTI